MLTGFRTYHLAVEFYKQCKDLKLQPYLKDQLQRAALSVVLNLAEGSAKPTIKERKRFYSIAMASYREVQAILEVTENNLFNKQYDHLGGMLYKLARHQP